jgi:hypothetical protein
LRAGFHASIIGRDIQGSKLFRVYVSCA